MAGFQMSTEDAKRARQKRGDRCDRALPPGAGAVDSRVIGSAFFTAQQRDLDADAVFTTLLHARAPIISPQFYPASASVN
jgi:hypothetical protein